MATNSHDTFLKHWNWLRLEYNSVDLTLRERLQVLVDANASNIMKGNALIDAAALLCRSLSEAKRKGLFEALVQDVSANSDVALMQSEIAGHLELFLHLEEQVLIQVGIDPSSAQALRNSIAELPSSTWRHTPLGANAFHKKVDEALKATCSKAPTTYVELKFKGWLKKADELKKSYGLLGAVTIGAANAVAIHTIPEPITATKFSSLIGYIFGGGAGGA